MSNFSLAVPKNACYSFHVVLRGDAAEELNKK